MDYCHMPHKGIQELIPYKAGKSIEELAKEKGLTDIVKLASNENPLGCSSKVLKYFQNLSGEAAAMYPHPHQHPLRQALAHKLGVEDSQILISNGSDAIFTLLLNLFCLHRNKHLLTHSYAFASYEIQAQTLGIPVKKAPVDKSMCLNLDSILGMCSADTGIIMFANPNNPTGTLISVNDIVKFLQAVPPEIIVLVDEAYFEFAFDNNEESALPLLRQFPNLVITRTFSKIYGLAGLRLGYAIASPELVELMWRVQLPFACNTVAMQAGLIALEDEAFVQQTLEINHSGMRQVSKGLEALALPCLPSACNFITFNCQHPALDVYQFLLNYGVITRPLDAYGLSDYIRVSIGTEYQNQRFLDTTQRFYTNI